MRPKQQPDTNGLDSSNGSRIETADSRFIRLLTFLCEAGGTVSTDETDSIEDVRAYAELVSGGFISGKVGRDGSGAIGYVSFMEITIPGRAYLAELKHAAEAQTSLGFVKTHRFKVYGWFFGIFAAIAAALYVWYLTHH